MERRCGMGLAILAALLLAASCDRGDRPPRVEPPGPGAGPPPPMPPPPAWSSPLAGKPFAAAYPSAGARCDSAVDGVTARLRDGVTMMGWGWDPLRKRVVERVIFVDRAGRMVGFGEGHVPRPDVPQNLPEVSALDTGWVAHLPRPTEELTVYGVLSDGTACRMGVAPVG